MSNATHDNITLVLGANGKTGGRVTERLAALGRPVRRGSRSGHPPFDWTDPSTWTPVLDGVDAVYIAYYPDLGFPGANDVVGAFADEAVANGVRRLVLISGRGEEVAQLGEQRVQNSGADCTIVRCAFFNQNFTDAFVEPVRHGVLSMPAGTTTEPFVDADDIADVVVAALTDARHIGQVYELTGPRLMSFDEVAAELSKATGREIRYVPVSAADYADELKAFGMPAAEAEPLAHLLGELLDGHNSYLTDGVQRALGRPPRDFADYARDTAASGVWDREEPTA